MEKHSVLFCFFLLFEVIISSCDGSEAISFETRRKADAYDHLSRLNKTPLKSIKSPDGDIIDCVDIHKQPSFDHPLLKNHSIMMRPSHIPKGKFGNNHSGSYKGVPHQLWRNHGSCPKGTIPIRRIKNADLLRVDSIEKLGKKSSRSSPTQSKVVIENFEYANILMEGEKFYGAKARMSVWKPHVQIPEEFSLAFIWIKGGPMDSGFNGIDAGWQVYPIQYGDNNPRLHIYWTSDHYRSTGCYNLGCPGFVQISRDILLGGTLEPTSTYDGEDHYFDLQIFKSSKDKAWWLVYGKRHVVGYWPDSLFTRLNDSANQIEMGGEVINRRTDGKHTTTEMGSGHFSKEGYKKAGYFKNIQVVYEKKYEDPVFIQTDVNQNKCYNVDISIQEGSGWGRHFFYGGPGRNPNCS